MFEEMDELHLGAQTGEKGSDNNLKNKRGILAKVMIAILVIVLLVTVIFRNSIIDVVNSVFWPNSIFWRYGDDGCWVHERN